VDASRSCWVRSIWYPPNRREAAAADKAPIRVTIYGQTFSVLTEADPREVDELAREIDELMSSVASRSGIADTSRLALLVCLHLADQLKSERREKAGIKAELENRIRKVATMLDQVSES